MEWISENHEVLTLFFDFLTVLVWFFYAQLLLANYRRQRRPTLLVNQGAGKSLDSRCIISNMSAEPIYVYLVIIRVDTDEGSLDCDVTDYPDADEQGSISSRTMQGPLQSGQYREFRSFRSIINQALRQYGYPELEEGATTGGKPHSLAINVLAEYGPGDQPVGACRNFELQEEDGWTRLKPTSDLTQRLVDRHQRQNVKSWLEEYL